MRHHHGAMRAPRRRNIQRNDDTVGLPASLTERVLHFDSSNKPIDPSLPIELLTVHDVAKIFKISVSTVRRLQDQRRIPFHKVGGSIRFAKDDLVSFVARQRVDRVG
jgi:excisionase family DNA binding protein